MLEFLSQAAFNGVKLTSCNSNQMFSGDFVRTFFIYVFAVNNNHIFSLLTWKNVLSSLSSNNPAPFSRERVM